MQIRGAPGSGEENVTETDDRLEKKKMAPVSPHDRFHRARSGEASADLSDLDSLSVEPLESGVAVYGPDFYVWDREGDAAFSWATELLAAPRSAAPWRPRR